MLDAGNPSVPEPIAIYATVTNHAPPPPPQPAGARAYFPLWTELLKAIAWPLLALTFFIMFHSPIARTIALIPDKLEKADKGNIGSLSWEIKQQAKEQGGSDLAERVGTLSPAAIEELVKTPRDGSMGFVSSLSGRQNAYTIPFESRITAFLELEAAQLLRFKDPLADWLAYVAKLPLQTDESVKLSYGRTVFATEPLTPQQHRKLDEQSYELTPKGKQAVEAIVTAIGEQLKAAERPPTTSH